MTDNGRANLVWQSTYLDVDKGLVLDRWAFTLQVSYRNKTAVLQIDPTDDRLPPAEACRLEIHRDLMAALKEWCRLGDEIGDVSVSV